MLKLRGPAEDKRAKDSHGALYPDPRAESESLGHEENLSKEGVCVWGGGWGVGLARGCISLPKSKSSAKRITSPSVTQAIPWGK